jgi:MFS family permease
VLPARAVPVAGFALFGAFWGVWGASLPRVQAHAGVGVAGLGVALLWIGAGALVTIRWAGGVSDRVGRWALPAALATLGAASVLPVLARGVPALSAALFVVGLCSGAADATINAAAVRAEHSGKPLMNLCHGVFSASVVVASLAVAALVGGGHGPPWSLAVVGALIVAASFALLAVGQRTPELDPDPDPPIARGPRRRVLSRPLLILGGLAAVAYLVENAWQSWAAIQLHSSAGASVHTAAAGPAVFAGAAAFGRFSGHAVAARVTPRKLVAAGAVTAAVGSAAAALATAPATVMAGIAIAGCGTAVCAPTLISLSRRHAPPADYGAATGTVVTIAYLGFVFGPALVGLAAGVLSLRAALLGVAGAALLLAAASAALPQPRSRIQTVTGPSSQERAENERT